MKLYKAQVCPFSDESKVAKFLFPSPLQFYFSFYGWIETCCPDLLHQFMCGPYSSLNMDLIGCWLLLFALVVVVAVWLALGNIVRVYPETVQGLTFYHSKIYITKNTCLCYKCRVFYCAVLSWLHQWSNHCCW